LFVDNSRVKKCEMVGRGSLKYYHQDEPVFEA